MLKVALGMAFAAVVAIQVVLVVSRWVLLVRWSRFEAFVYEGLRPEKYVARTAGWIAERRAAGIVGHFEDAVDLLVGDSYARLDCPREATTHFARGLSGPPGKPPVLNLEIVRAKAAISAAKLGLFHDVLRYTDDLLRTSAACVVERQSAVRLRAAAVWATTANLPMALEVLHFGMREFTECVEGTRPVDPRYFVVWAQISASATGVDSAANMAREGVSQWALYPFPTGPQQTGEKIDWTISTAVAMRILGRAGYRDEALSLLGLIDLDVIRRASYAMAFVGAALAETSAREGAVSAARAHLAEAVQNADRVVSTDVDAELHVATMHVEAALGNLDQARHHRDAATICFELLGDLGGLHGLHLATKRLSL